MTEPNKSDDSSIEPELISRTQLKREAQERQQLGRQLLKLSTEQLEKMELPEHALDALAELKRIKDTSSAWRRQLRYVGSALEPVELVHLKQKLDFFSQKNGLDGLVHKQAEQFRTRLLVNDPESLNDLMNYCKEPDWQHWRQLVRSARKEQQSGQSGKHQKALYRAIRELLQQQ